MSRIRRTISYPLSSILIPLILLAACTQGAERDYDASAKCAGIGLQAGTPEFKKCAMEEHKAKMLEQQRKEFEARKQYEEDWKMRRR